jgi:hypothetical protein|tara:strand:+ start:5200 stop:5442 length:243 start_codon:yes stop_codon:yes gene_type:complete
VDVRFHKGDYVRWVTGHSVYEAYEDRIVGAKPIYRYGIIIEVSEVDPRAIIVHSALYNHNPKLVILSEEMDEIEVLSSVR